MCLRLDVFNKNIQSLIGPGRICGEFVKCQQQNMMRPWTVVIGVILGSVGMSTPSVVWTVRPDDVVAFVGQTFTLSCAINSALTGYDNHHWVRLDPRKSERQSFLTEGKYISSTLTEDKRRRYSVTSQAVGGGYTLRVSQATIADSGLYGCLVYSRTNVHRRSLSSFAKVDVVPIALPTGSPGCDVEPPHPTPGTSVLFSCSSRVDGLTTNLSWTLGGEPVTATTVLAGDRSILTFRKTLGDMDNQAEYTCTEQWSARGSQRSSCSIVPLDMPVNVSVIPKSVKVVSKEAATFTCNAESVPPATSYTWYFEGHPVSERPDLFKLTDGGKKMTILSVIGEDFSKYTVRCSVQNALNMKRSVTAFLDVIPLSQRIAILERKLKNHTLDDLDTDEAGNQNSGATLKYDSTLVTVLIALTASVGTAILLVLAMVLIACLRKPIKRRMSSNEDGDQQPLHITCLPMNEVLNGSPPSRKSSSGQPRRRPLSSSSYQPLRREYSVSGGSLSSVKKSLPPRKVSLPAVPHQYAKSVSLYENATPLQLSLAEGLDRDKPSKSSRKGPFGPVSI